MSLPVVVTGASRGIGRALVLEYAARKVPTIAAARSEKDLDALVTEVREKHGVECTPVVCDLSTEQGVRALEEAAPDKVLGLVNNAGFGLAGRFDTFDRARDRQQIRLNVEALTDLCHAFLPRLRGVQGAFLVNVASTAAFQAVPLFSTYAATKAYVLSFTEALAEELAPEGIHVFCACPGLTESGFQAEADVTIPDGKAPGSAEVAAWIVKCVDARKRVSVHGFSNALLAFGTRVGPRKLNTRMAMRTMEPWFAGRK